MVGKKQPVCISLDVTSSLLKGNNDKDFKDTWKFYLCLLIQTGGGVQQFPR